MFIDTHCHLDFDIFDKNRKQLINNCGKLGVANFINPATQKKSWDKQISINTKFSNITICFGLHPVFIDKHISANLHDLEEYTVKHNTKLIGEIGLDKRIKSFPKQTKYFSSQVSIAKNLNKKIIIHSVKTHNEIIKTLKDFKYLNGGIIHAFNGSYDMAKQFIDLGFKLGIGGIISKPNSKLKNILKQISYTDIVLETDSPDMKLYNSTEQINTPENIPLIFKIISDIYQVNPDILKQEIYNTSIKFI